MAVDLIWMTFDLGVRGDYEGLFAFLDNYQAKECGDAAAVFEFEYKRDLESELRRELAQAVTLDKRSRIYLVWPDKKTGRYKGRFLVGKRKQAPWTGYGASVEQEEDIGDDSIG